MEENHFTPNTPEQTSEKTSKSVRENKSKDGNIEAEEKSTKKTAEKGNSIGQNLKLFWAQLLRSCHFIFFSLYFLFIYMDSRPR